MLEQVIIGKNVLVPDVGYPTCRTQGKSQQCVLDRTIGGYEEITEEGMREEWYTSRYKAAIIEAGPTY